MNKADEKKIVKGLECCISSSKECEGCPYASEKKCGTMQRMDALSLIRNYRKVNKAQEKVIKELQAKLHESEKDAEKHLKKVKELTDAQAFLVMKVIDAVKSKASRSVSSCMASGDMRELFTIRGRDLDDIIKKIGGEQ